jgi:hypothetical protein
MLTVAIFFLEKAGPQEVDPLVVEVDIAEGLKVDKNFNNRFKRHILVKVR